MKEKQKNKDIIKENKLKALKISQCREKAKEIANLTDFNSMTIYNHVIEVNLKGKDVEYERNLNPRYTKHKDEIYKDDSRYNLICNKANKNFSRLMQIVNNANKDFIGDSQYIVFHKALVESIRSWLDSFLAFSSHLKYGKLEDDIVEFKKIFPSIDKEWLVIDGNSYFSTIHQIYLTERSIKKESETLDVKYWAKFYAQKSSKGKGYTKDILYPSGYERDIQMLQLLSLALEKNTYSWDNEDIKLFYQRLNRLLFAIVCKQGFSLTANDLFVTMQAIKYLILPHKKPILFQQSKRMDFMTFVSLFKNENEDSYSQLQDTTYNIKIFRTIIEGMITKNSNHLNLDYVLDCLNEVFKAMVNYQNLSLELLKDTEGQSARDRLTKIDTLCKQKLRENHTLKDEIVNEQLPVYLVRIKLHELVSMMVETYKDYLSHNIQVMIQKNPNLMKNIHSIYNIGNIQQQMTIEEFTIIFMDSIKINN